MSHKQTAPQIARLQHIIDKQIESNKGKNLFLNSQARSLKFIEDALQAIPNITELSAESEQILIDYTTEKALEEFYRVNQYYTVNSAAKNNLRHLYSVLFLNLKEHNRSAKSISEDHYERIKTWLQETNPFAEKIYANAQAEIEPVACSQYSAELQCRILRLDITNLTEPILDIGCGKHGQLVNYLCNLGLDATGIDRYAFNNSNLTTSDWLEYAYGTEKWGTIVSHLGFSNHFKSHNLREDGNYIEYGKTYMNILTALKIGGRFHYAPDLPFIERYLDKTHVQVEQHNIGEFDFKTTVVTRLN